MFFKNIINKTCKQEKEKEKEKEQESYKTR